MTTAIESLANRLVDEMNRNRSLETILQQVLDDCCHNFERQITPETIRDINQALGYNETNAADALERALANSRRD